MMRIMNQEQETDDLFRSGVICGSFDLHLINNNKNITVKRKYIL
jgi:hypothetical protein